MLCGFADTGVRMYERLKRCGLLGLSFVVVLTAYFSAYSGKTYAVTNANYSFSSFANKAAFVKCGNTNGQNRAGITAANSQINFDSADSWLFEGTGGTTATPSYQQLWYVKAPHKITAYYDSTAGQFKYKAPVDSGTAISWLVQANSSGGGAGSTTSYNMNGQGSTQKCYYSAKNISYDSTWTSQMGGFAQIPGDDGKYECDTWDVVCKVKNIFTGIADTFINVGEAIVNGISLLFSPDTSAFGVQFDELTDFMADKFGFLFYPIDWIIDTLGQIESRGENNTSWGIGACNATKPTLSVPEIPNNGFFGGSPTISFCNLGGLEYIIRVLAQMGISIVLIYAFRHKIHEIKTRA